MESQSKRSVIDFVRSFLSWEARKSAELTRKLGLPVAPPPNTLLENRQQFVIAVMLWIILGLLAVIVWLL